MLHDIEIVDDEQIGQVELLLQVVQKVDQLGLSYVSAVPMKFFQDSNVKNGETCTIPNQTTIEINATATTTHP
jgi:hypothetical protein